MKEAVIGLGGDGRLSSVFAGGSGESASTTRGAPLVNLSVLGELETLDGSLALLRNIADNVRNGIGLVLEVPVGNVGEARARVSLAVADGLEHGLANLAIELLTLETNLELSGDILGLGEGLDDVLHVVALAADEAAEVEHYATGLVALAQNGGVGMLESSQLLLVPLALALELLGNLLLEDESLESVVALLLRTGKTDRHASIVVLLLVEEPGQTTVLSLVVLDLDLEVLGLLGELLSKGLEFEEL